MNARRSANALPQHGQVALLHVARRWEVTAVPPGNERRMVAQPAHFTPQRLFRDSVVFLLPLVPLFPMVTATEAADDQHAVAIAASEEVRVREHALEADRVQVQLFDVLVLVQLAL